MVLFLPFALSVQPFLLGPLYSVPQVGLNEKLKPGGKHVEFDQDVDVHLHSWITADAICDI